MTESISKAVNAPAPVGLPVVDSQDVFPVHRIYCVGRNYAAHAVEMGHCLLYTSPSPRDLSTSRMPSSA